MQSVSGIGHVAIRVKDIGKSLDFYVDRLGFSEMFRLHRDNKLWIVYLRVTDGQFIELFPEATGDKAQEETVVGLNHLCLEVTDIDKAIAEVTAKGIEIWRPKKEGADFNLQAWIKDPDGNRIELMQLGAKAMQAAAIASLKAGNHKVPVFNV
jgi:lactoylglutathione lyase